jgi:ribosomal protein S6
MMLSNNKKKSYNCLLIIPNMRNKVDLQLVAYSYAKLLKQLGASSIVAVTKANYILTYPIKKISDVKFVEFSFQISPKALNSFQQHLQINESILRFFLTTVE